MTMLSAGVSGSVAKADAAEVRLRGTVFEHVPTAHGAYRLCLALGSIVGRAGISANALTYVSLALAAAAGVAAAFGAFGLSAGLVVVSGLFDMLDGAVARATRTVSRWGALLDSTVDRLSDGFPLLGITVFYAGTGNWLVAVPALAMMGAFTVSYVRARAEALGVKLPALFMRRAERVILVTLSLLLGVLPLDGAPFAAPLLFIGVALLGVLNFVGSVWALKAARHALLSDSETASAR
jgi:CDP-diacylglycerol--glycerol-3-phosphate 3-phosphatidyltransferase